METNYNPPFFLRLGFFGKKGLLIMLFIYPVYNFLMHVILVNDIPKILEYLLPYYIIILSFCIFIISSGIWILNQINLIFGIDLRYKDVQFNKITKLSKLFEAKQYIEYQKFVLNRFSSSKKTFFLLVIAIFFSIFAWTLPFALKTDVVFIYFPIINSNPQYLLYLVLIAVPITLFAIYTIFSCFSGIILLIDIIYCFNKLSRFPGLAINKIHEIIEIQDEKKDSVDFPKRSEIVRFSLKRFKRHCRIVPRFLLSINFIMTIGSLLVSLFFLYFLLEASKASSEQQTMVFFMFVIIVIIVSISNIIIFIFPQISLHNQLEEGKEFFLESLEEIYELKKFQYLRIAEETVPDIQSEKRVLWVEIQALSSMIEEIEGLMTWPFNYNQLFSVMLGTSIAIIPVVIGLLIEYNVFSI